MIDIWNYLNGTGIVLFDALIILFFIALGFLYLLRQNRKLKYRLPDLDNLEKIEHKLRQLEEENSLLFDLINHRLRRVLSSVRSWSLSTIPELKNDQTNLRVKQQKIIHLCDDLERHTLNTLGIISLNQQLENTVFSHDLVSLQGILQEILTEELHQVIKAKSVQLRTNLLDLEPLMANREFVKDIFANVIHNAIKYSDENSPVEIKLNLLEEARNRFVAQVIVKDWGNGIKESDKEKIFRLRERGESHTKSGGGLGLYFARRLARLHGGDVILVESTLGQGATFAITLPYT